MLIRKNPATNKKAITRQQTTSEGLDGLFNTPDSLDDKIKATEESLRKLIIQVKSQKQFKRGA